jgi:UDP-glucose 4-epimerase
MMCEQMLRDCSASSKLSFMILRYFNAAGADPDGEIGECHDPETHAIPLILAAAAGERPFTVFGNDYPTADGTCVRDYVHVTDLAHAHVLALRALLDGSDSLAMNIGTGRGWSLLELINIASQITSRSIPMIVGPRRRGDPPALVSECSIAHARLGWSPRYPDVAKQISHAWAWRQKMTSKIAATISSS